MVSSLCLLQSRRLSSSRCAPPIVAIRFGASVQLVSSLFSSHNGGSPEEIAQEAERSRRDRTRRVGQVCPADPTEMATLQAAAGTVDSK
jgi:hypothetical protein